MRCERFGFPAFEANVDRGDVFGLFDEGGIFDDVGEQPLAFAVGCIWIGPDGLEIASHCREASADGPIDNQPILLPALLPRFLGLSQTTQLVVPLAFESIGDQAIARVHHHEATLGQIRRLLRTLHGSAAKPVSFLVSCLGLPSDLKSQFDCSGSHLLSNERANRRVNGRSINRLADGSPSLE